MNDKSYGEPWHAINDGQVSVGQCVECGGRIVISDRFGYVDSCVCNKEGDDTRAVFWAKRISAMVIFNERPEG